MNILFLVSSMKVGGAERVAALLCSAWAERGEDVTLMPTFSGRGGVGYPLSKRVGLNFLADHVGGRTGRLARIWALRRHIRATRPDVIVSFLPTVNVAALVATLGTSVPVIACERTFPPALRPKLPWSYEVLRRLLYPRAAILVGQSVGVRAWLRQYFPRNPSVIIPNPVEIPIPRALPNLQPNALLETARNIVLCVGRLDGPKRPSLLVEAFAAIAPDFPDWDLVILGEGPLRPELEAQIVRLGLSGRAYLPGRVGNIEDWYTRAQVFCLPSSYEGFPNALLEAMASGLPTVAFDIMTGPREITEDGQRGFLLPDDNHKARLANALRTLMADPDRRAELAGRAAEIRNTYSTENVLSMWDNAIGQAIGVRKRTD